MCLDSIFSQKFPVDKYEIIVVNDASSDETSVVIDRFKKLYLNLKHIKLSRRYGPAKARNQGILEACGDIIAFTDNDCVLGSNWIRKILSKHNEHPKIVAIGGYTFVKKSSLKAQINQFMANGAIKADINNRQETIFFPTCNVSFKKEILDKEKFNELFKYPAGEDLEFFWRLYKKGYDFLYSEDIKVCHNVDSSFLHFLYQPYTYGRENFLVRKIHKDHPALEDLNSDNIIKFLFCLLKEFIKSSFLTIILANRFKLGLKKNKHNNYNYFFVIFYFFLFRISYLIGNTIQGINNIINAKYRLFCKSN